MPGEFWRHFKHEAYGNGAMTPNADFAVGTVGREDVGFLPRAKLFHRDKPRASTFRLCNRAQQFTDLSSAIEFDARKLLMR